MISNSEERLKYAQFWFLRMTPLDDEAFNHLFAGMPKRALSLWDREENLSSLQNKVVIYLWKCDFKLALKTTKRLYRLFSDKFLKAVDSKGTLVKSSADLIQSFVDTLVEYIPPVKLLDYVPSSSWLDYIVPTISEDAFSKINKALQNAQDQLELLNSERRKAEDSLPKAGIGGKLFFDIQKELDLLKKVSSPDNPRLQLTSDRLANMFYECSIDEYNLRNFSPDYSVLMLNRALDLSNNSVDKEEINKKIDLFKKKMEKSVEVSEQERKAENIIGVSFLILMLILAILGNLRACHI